MTADETLRWLDTQFEIVHHDPPHLYQLWTHFYPADARLTAFRSADRWALVFELLGYWSGPQAVRLDISVYTNASARMAARYESTPLQLLDAQTDSPLDGGGALDPRQFSALWGGRRYDFAPSGHDYAEFGIVFDPARSNPRAHANAQIVRYLCERLGHPFFLPEDELRELLADGASEADQSQTAAMTLLLQTRNWRHPDLSQEELPSQVQSFQILAHALETGDAAAWGLQDPASFNTDWRRYDWEEKTEEEQRRLREARQEREWGALTPEMRARIAEEAGAGTPEFILLPAEPERPLPE